MVLGALGPPPRKGVAVTGPVWLGWHWVGLGLGQQQKELRVPDSTLAKLTSSVLQSWLESWLGQLGEGVPTDVRASAPGVGMDLGG